MSRHNVEVYRCVLCTEEVVTVPDGFTISEDELNLKLDDHLTNDCVARAQPIEEVEGSAENPAS